MCFLSGNFLKYSLLNSSVLYYFASDESQTNDDLSDILPQEIKNFNNYILEKNNSNSFNIKKFFLKIPIELLDSLKMDPNSLNHFSFSKYLNLTIGTKNINSGNIVETAEDIKKIVTKKAGFQFSDQWKNILINLMVQFNQNSYLSLSIDLIDCFNKFNSFMDGFLKSLCLKIVSKYLIVLSNSPEEILHEVLGLGISMPKEEILHRKRYANDLVLDGTQNKSENNKYHNSLMFCIKFQLQKNLIILFGTSSDSLYKKKISTKETGLLKPTDDKYFDYNRIKPTIYWAGINFKGFNDNFGCFLKFEYWKTPQIKLENNGFFEEQNITLPSSEFHLYLNIKITNYFCIEIPFKLKSDFDIKKIKITFGYKFFAIKFFLTKDFAIEITIRISVFIITLYIYGKNWCLIIGYDIKSDNFLGNIFDLNYLSSNKIYIQDLDTHNKTGKLQQYYQTLQA